MAEAPLIEVFSSIQGEGRYAGVPMTFVRVAVCPIRCTYCDTPNSYTAASSFPVRTGDREVAHDNPVTGSVAAELAVAAAAQNPYGVTRMVSLTGGEPLVYPDFVREFGQALHGHGLRLFLETAALDAAAFLACAGSVDHASLDYKLPGTLAAGDAIRAGEQCVACVAHAVGGAMTVDVKMVLTRAVELAAVAHALVGLRPYRSDIRLVLQPVTPFGAEDYPCPPDRIAAFARLATEQGFEPRVLPQLHKVLGVP